MHTAEDKLTGSLLGLPGKRLSATHELSKEESRKGVVISTQKPTHEYNNDLTYGQ